MQQANQLKDMKPWTIWVNFSANEPTVNIWKQLIKKSVSGHDKHRNQMLHFVHSKYYKTKSESNYLK